MELITKCQICNQKIAKFSCKKCGRNVCEDHFDSSKGVCVICSKGISYKK